jgi:triosephosphate isomerase
MPKRPRIIGGNWKMNTDRAGAAALVRAVYRGLAAVPRHAVVVIFPPFPYLLTAVEALADLDPVPGFAIGAQDAWHEPDGAFTGEVSLAMLKDCSCQCVLVGHSERRHVLGESDALVNKKARAALAADVNVILCIGETLEQRTAGKTDSVNERQLRTALDGVPAEHVARLAIAYEPVWAIGTGRTASPDDAQDAHAKIRRILAEMYSGEIADATCIQYGGSVKASNALELFSRPDIDGGLIGGASLKADEFLAIVNAAG